MIKVRQILERVARVRPIAFEDEVQLTDAQRLAQMEAAMAALAGEV